MTEISNNRKSNNLLVSKKDQYSQFDGEIEEIKLKDIKSKVKKIKTNIFFKEDNKYKIFNKRRALNSAGNSLFSNVEIKKFINETNKSNIQKGNNYIIRKIGDMKDVIIRNDLTGKLKTNINYEKGSNFKYKKELKEQSTNTYINDIDINNNESDTQRICSLDSNKNNIQEVEIIKPKALLNKKNNYLNIVPNMKIFNSNKKNKIIAKRNHINNISINNNIKFNNESNKNNYNFYFELYNFHLIQSIIQNRSNYFDLKNNHLLNIYTPKSPNPSNLTFFMNNSNTNKLSLRELYRNLNKGNEFSNFLKLNQNIRDKSKKKRTKSYNGKNLNKNRNIFERNSKYKLMNVQYNLDKNGNLKYKDTNSIFQQTFFSKRISNINNKILKKIHKTESKDKNYIKTSFNYYNNNDYILKKYKTRILDELDKGLSNSTTPIKSFAIKHSKKLNKWNNTNN